MSRRSGLCFFAFSNAASYVSSGRIFSSALAAECAAYARVSANSVVLKRAIESARASAPFALYPIPLIFFTSIPEIDKMIL